MNRIRIGKLSLRIPRDPRLNSARLAEQIREQLQDANLRPQESRQVGAIRRSLQLHPNEQPDKLADQIAAEIVRSIRGTL